MAQAGTNFPKVTRMLFNFFSFNFRIFSASFHAASQVHRSSHSVSSWDRSSNFGALGLRWWGSPGQIIPSEGFWSRMLAWRTTAAVNWTHRIGVRMFELLRKIDEDFGGSISWNTQPNCRVLFSIATALLSPSFLEPFARLFFNLAMRTRALFYRICIHSRTCTTSILEDAIFHRMNWCNFLWGNPCMAIETFSHWETFLWDFGFSTDFSHSVAWKISETGSAVSVFARLLISCRKLQIVSFRTLPVGFPLPTIS